MKEQPKPCPHCGWGTIVDMGGLFSHAAGCNSCGARTKKYKTWKEAVHEWNRRAESENPPLTLEQLKQMDGQPVYIVFLLEPDKSEWKLLDGNTKRCTLFRSDYSLFNDGYGKTWIAYAHKPEAPNA